jgi:hypothetical protein
MDGIFMRDMRLQALTPQHLGEAEGPVTVVLDVALTGAGTGRTCLRVQTRPTDQSDTLLRPEGSTQRLI